jgi:hypothetical protein
MRKKNYRGQLENESKKRRCFYVGRVILWAGYLRLGLSENKIMLLAPSFCVFEFCSRKNRE